jgi:hypothetical protein
MNTITMHYPPHQIGGGPGSPVTTCAGIRRGTQGPVFVPRATQTEIDVFKDRLRMRIQGDAMRLRTFSLPYEEIQDFFFEAVEELKNQEGIKFSAA